MIRKRHPSAPTDTATRREIQQSEESDRAPVARLGRDQRTITEGPPSSINRLLQPRTQLRVQAQRL